MESSRSKRRRLISSNVSPRRRPDLPAIFESLNDDTLTTILEFVGNKSYATYAGINKQCREVYLSSGMTKETFVYGYGPLSVIQNRYDNNPSYSARVALSKGVLFFNRKDVLGWAFQERKTYLLREICNVAAGEGRLDLLNQVLYNIEDEDDKRFIFEEVDCYAAKNGTLNVLKWYDTKGFNFYKDCYAEIAAKHGHLHILKWLREEKRLELERELYCEVIWGSGQLHVMKWLREQEVDWDDWTFRYAAWNGNINILQWLHNEGCPWPRGDAYLVSDEDVTPEVIDWCRSNGYGDRIVFTND
eukprot:CAMPEP_0178967800 /NCGR_PEP_ID=MMETSP0789-20121207/17831_1 /TAXON_ID=3005 /ORGANISM="Rhizosolenia setigera, Strain CCMP 1694" /LENGTH=301 /DNA_ID=CAMNT_0020653521 /DNA_START=30 /DNA_END=935 /DNA_ORIENTATION=+